MIDDRPSRTEIVPIFVLGSGRSGTTWLCNELSCHDQIAGAHHRVHWGAQESVILRTQLWAGQWTDLAAFIRFHEVYSSSDYFILTQGDKEALYRERPVDFFDYFLTLMDRFALRSGVACWVTKLDPFFFYYPGHLEEFLKRLDQRYADCKWVRISRSFPATLRSALNNEGDRSAHMKSWLAKYGVSATYSARHVAEARGHARLVDERGGYSLTYEQLRRDRESCLEGLCGYLGVRHRPGGPAVPYSPNSSYVDPSRPRHDTWSRIYLSLAILRPLFSLIPALAVAAVRLREWARGRTCPLTWRLLTLAQAPTLFSRELLRTGQTGLHAQLFDSDGNPKHREEDAKRVTASTIA